MNNPPTRILLATDGSEPAASAVRAAVDLANKSGAELHVVYAFEFVPLREFAAVALRLRRPRGLAEGKRHLDEQVGRIEDAGGPVAGAWLRMGSPVREILAVAEEIDAGLVVLGRRDLGEVERLLGSSVSERLVQRSSRPVLVVRGGGEVWPPARVLIADDSSAAAERAGELAADIGRLFAAEESQVYPGAPESEAQGPGQDEARSGRSPKRLPEAKLVVGGGDDGTRGIVAKILGVAGASGGPTLISIGSRARAGSVPTEVLRTAKGPVLVFPQSYVHAAGSDPAVSPRRSRRPATIVPK